MQQDSRVLVIGLDGACFDLIKPWVSEGQLPVLGGLMKNGVWGDLRSVVPTISAPAWVSFMTGKNPGKHGILDFVSHPRPGERQPQLISSLSFDDRTLWDILGSHGRTVGVVNVPVTYPPRNVNGYLISGFMTPPSAQVFTYPPELAKEIPGYRIDTRFARARHRDGGKYESRAELPREQHDITERRASAVLKLLDKWPTDFFIVVFKGTDNMQHYFWDRKEVLLDYYRSVDDAIGRIGSKVGPNANIFVVSDHGFGPRGTKEFSTNAWLEGQGLLKTKRGAKSRLGQSLSRFALEANRRMELGRRLPSNVAGAGNRLLAQETEIIWSQTKAYGREDLTSIAAIDINLQGEGREGTVATGRDYESLRERVVKRLREFEDPETGSRVMAGVFKREELYSGRHLSSMPDVIGVPDPRYVVKNKMLFSKRVLADSTEMMAGEHYSQPNGILIACGPDVRKGLEVTDSRLIDIAPTVLHIMGVPVPRDMDGVVLKEILDQDSQAATREIAYDEADTGRQKIKENIGRLRDLGRL
jgi:predicted AlkP superfamily phosphohydrolase/phosphomutase